jgi:hypothetical protein
VANSEALEPLEGWGRISHGRFETTHAGHTWTIDVDFFDWDQWVTLYRDSQPVERRKAPTSFRLDSDATVEVATSLLGMGRADLVLAGEIRPLTPSEGTAERWRLRLAREHPGLTRALEAATPAVLVLASLVGLVKLAALIGLVEDVVPAGVAVVLGLAAVVAVIDRSLRSDVG